MTINEMLQQVALLTGGDYSRQGDVSSISVNLPTGRKQIIYARVQRISDEDMGLLFTEVSELRDEVDLVALLELNAILKYSKVTVVDRKDIVLLATFDLANTSVRECAPILQELASIADELERKFIGLDTH
jgi:hypothetical protein